MKRILCIVGGMNAGGAETFLMKLYRGMDRELYQMDFCVSKPEKGFYDDEIKAMGGRIIHTTPKSKGIWKSFTSIRRIVKENHYEYVMRVSQHSLSALELVAARKGGAKVTVFRSSNSNTTTGKVSTLLHKFFKFLSKTAVDVKIAPSYPAAEFMFGKRAIKNGKVVFLKNGIPLHKFSYSSTEREKFRNELGITDELLIGHIGRFSHQKNHEQLIDIFGELLKRKKDAHLMLIGEGELQSAIADKVKQAGMEDNVHFLGLRSDIPSVLSAMDVFVFPSFYEGMPNTVIEAQANGVPCVISDQITEEVKMCENIVMLPLNNNSIWVEAIEKSVRLPSENNQKVLAKQGYDINSVCSEFVSLVFEHS